MRVTSPLNFFRKLVLEILANLMKYGGGWGGRQEAFPLEENVSNRGKGRCPKGRSP